MARKLPAKQYALYDKNVDKFVYFNKRRDELVGSLESVKEGASEIIKDSSEEDSDSYVIVEVIEVLKPKRINKVEWESV